MTTTKQPVVTWVILDSMVDSFDVWKERPGIAAISVYRLPRNAYLTAGGSRRALRALVREVFDEPSWKFYYDDIKEKSEEV